MPCLTRLPLCFALFLATLGLRAAADSVVLAPGVSVVVDPQEPAPIFRAIQDLQRDLKAVLGADSATSSGIAPGTPAIVVTCHGESTRAARDPALTGTEAHELRVHDGQIVLQGTDVRGTIYAIYEFSDRFLNVPPLWYWMQRTPVRHDRISIPAEFKLAFGSPTIRYRTWFPNDTDMLHPWLDESREHYEAMFEALLRLKANVLDIDYISNLPQPSRGLIWARTCRDRGIMVTSTHTAPFGIRWTPGWEPYWKLGRHQEPPKLLLANEDKFWEFWRYFIELARREHLEMLWQIAFRGDFDKKMSLTFADAGDDPKKLAPLVDRMLRREVAFLKEVTGDPHPPMRAVLFEEVGQYYSQGLVNPPEEPSLVWTLGNDKMAMIPYEGSLKRVPPPAQALGFYFNLQYTAIGSHLSEAQSPRKLQQVISLVQQRSPTALGELMINVGNIREFPLGITAASRLAWNLPDFNPDEVTKDFCARYFGPESSARVAQLYTDLFAAYWQPRAPQAWAPVDRQYLFADLKAARYIEGILEMLRSGQYDGNPVKNSYRQGSLDPQYISGARNQLDAILYANDGMLHRLDKLQRDCAALADGMSPAERQIFRSSFATQVAYLRGANALLNQLIRAADALPDRVEVARQLGEAQPLAKTVVAILRSSDRDAFANWHTHAGTNGFRAADYGAEIAKLQASYSAAPPASSTRVSTTPLRVMSFNVRNSGSRDGANVWGNRKPVFFATINRFHPALIGFQEVLADQYDDIVRALPDYEFSGVARDDGKRKGEWALLGYRKDRFDRLAGGDFWLSEQPEVAGSKSWDAALTRICSWVQLRDRGAGRIFVYANTHFDHKGQQAREHSARVISQRLAAIARGQPMILTGDFNVTEDNAAYRTLVRPSDGGALVWTDSFREVYPRRGPEEASFNGFKPVLAGSRIDFILHTTGLSATAAEIDRTTDAGRLPSDHYPVNAILRWNEVAVATN